MRILGLSKKVHGENSLSLRAKFLAGGVLFFGVLLATMALGVMATVEIIDQRRGPAPPGPEEWMITRAISCPASQIRHIFSFTAGPMQNYDTSWAPGDRRRATLFQSGITPSPGYEYIPHVICFEDVPPDGVNQTELERLAVLEQEGLVGLLFFGGEMFAGTGNLSTWGDSPISDLMPVEVIDPEVVTGIDTGVVLPREKLELFKDFELDTLRIHELAKVKAKRGASVAASVKINGEEYPLMVWWEVNGARIVVWAGDFDDLYNWRTADFWASEGREGGPFLARKIVYFTAQRRLEDRSEYT